MASKEALITALYPAWLYACDVVIMAWHDIIYSLLVNATNACRNTLPADECHVTERCSPPAAAAGLFVCLSATASDASSFTVGLPCARPHGLESARIL